MNAFKTVSLEKDCVRILDQTRLPVQEVYLECRDLAAVATAIERLSVRGAPAIGVAAAMVLALEAGKISADNLSDFVRVFEIMCDRLYRTRPTAVNLAWAIDRMKQKVFSWEGKNIAGLPVALKEEACLIHDEDISSNRSMGNYGQRVLPRSATVMTICNTGALATAGYGTALGVVRAAIENHKDIFVVSCETRPLLQGARLTCCELARDNIPFELITDNMAGYYMKKKKVDAVIIGADRIAGNGDCANKIGSYSLSILARAHGVPFYIAAPVSTIDISAAGGDDIPIEERSANEVVCFNGTMTAPQGVQVWNPAFDVVPAGNISGIITEKGIIYPPFGEGIKKIVSN